MLWVKPVLTRIRQIPKSSDGRIRSSVINFSPSYWSMYRLQAYRTSPSVFVPVWRALLWPKIKFLPHTTLFWFVAFICRLIIVEYVPLRLGSMLLLLHWNEESSIAYFELPALGTHLLFTNAYPTRSLATLLIWPKRCTFLSTCISR